MITGMPGLVGLVHSTALITSTSMGEMAIDIHLALDVVLDDRHLVGKGDVRGGRLRDHLHVEAVRVGVLRRQLEEVRRRLEHAGDVGRRPTDDDGLRPTFDGGRRLGGGRCLRAGSALQELALSLPAHRTRQRAD